MRTKYAVVNEETQRGFSVWHSDLEIAKREAERLCKAHGGKFYVVQIVGAFEKKDVHWTEAEFDDGMPF